MSDEYSFHSELLQTYFLYEITTNAAMMTVVPASKSMITTANGATAAARLIDVPCWQDDMGNDEDGDGVAVSVDGAGWIEVDVIKARMLASSNGAGTAVQNCY